MFPLNLYARVRISLCINAHETAGAARTRSSLRPLTFEGQRKLQTSDAVCRENAESYLVVPASGPGLIQRVFVASRRQPALALMGPDSEAGTT